MKDAIEKGKNVVTSKLDSDGPLAESLLCMEMFEINDEHHLKAMSEMQELMQNPEAMTNWFENKRKEFEALPEG